MTTPILQLKSLGIDDLMKFDWVSAPPAETVLRALEGLYAAGMIDDSGKLTPVGAQVAEWPVEVGIARMVRIDCFHAIGYPHILSTPQLFSSKELSCGEEILTIAAMTAVQVQKSLHDAFMRAHKQALGRFCYSRRKCWSPS